MEYQIKPKSLALARTPTKEGDQFRAYKAKFERENAAKKVTNGTK